MARIRSIKPEFWTSEQIVELSATARLLFIGLWNFCDDAGNHVASAKTLKMEVFPGDDLSSAEVSKLVSELLHGGLLVQYQGDDGREYWHVTGWHHQHIEKPNYKHPAFPGMVGERSANGRRTVGDHSTPERNRKGEEIENSLSPAREAAGPFFESSTTGDVAPQVAPAPPAETESERTHRLIVADVKADDWAFLREAAQKAGYDGKTLGSVADEVRKFCGHYAAHKDPDKAEQFTADPVPFFREMFVRWLVLAKGINRKKRLPPDAPRYTPPPTARNGTGHITNFINPPPR